MFVQVCILLKVRQTVTKLTRGDVWCTERLADVGVERDTKFAYMKQTFHSAQILGRWRNVLKNEHLITTWRLQFALSDGRKLLGGGETHQRLFLKCRLNIRHTCFAIPYKLRASKGDATHPGH